MKFSLIAAAGALAAASQASALSIITPWASSVWTAGGHGEITWKVDATDAGLKCDIYLLNGDFKNSNIVAQITDPATPIDCSAAKYDMYPLNDFAAGTYWIRIGQSATGTWAYSAPFKFEGTGAAKPVSVVGGPSAAANGTAPAAASALPSSGSASASASASGSAKPSGPASASGSASASASASGAQSKTASATTSPSPTSGASSMSINTAAVALGAIAAVAFAL